MRIQRHLRSAACIAGLTALLCLPAPAEDAAIDTRRAEAVNETAKKNAGQATWDVSQQPSSGLVTSRQFDQLLPVDAPIRVRWALPLPNAKVRKISLPPADINYRLFLVETEQHDLIALRQDNGEAAWWVKLPGTVQGEIGFSHLSIVLCCEGRFIRLDRGTGKVVNNIDLPFAPASGPSILEENDQNHLFFITGMDRGVYAFTVAKSIWPPKGTESNISTADVSVELSHYSQTWKFTADGIVQNQPVLNDTRLIFGSWNKRVYGINLTGDNNNGQPSEYWEFRTRGSCQAAAVSDGPSSLLACTDGTLYSLSRGDGSLSWRYFAPDALLVAPQLLNDRDLEKSYALQKSGRNGPLICLDRISGNPLWQHDAGVKVLSRLKLEDHNPQLRFAAMVLTENGGIDCVQVSAPDARGADAKARDEASQNLRRASVAWSVPAQGFGLFAANAESPLVFCATADGSALCVLEESK